MGDDFEIVGKIVVDSSGAVGLQDVNDKLTDMKGRTEGLGGSTSAFGQIANFVWGGLIVKGVEMAGQAVMNFASGIVSATEEAQNVQAQLAAVLQSTGGAAGVTADQVNDLANSLSGMTRFDDEAITSGESMLLTFTNIGKDTFPAATSAMLDLSQAMGGDLKSSAIQLGKALNDPEKGMTALQRVGVTFTDAQKDVVKQMMWTGDVAGAQKVILDELSKEFGGSAVAAGKTFAGQMDILKTKLGNVQESIGNAVLPAVTNLLSTFEKTGAIDIFSKAFQTVLDAGGSPLSALTEGVGDFFLSLGSVSPVFQTIGESIFILEDGFDKLMDALANPKKALESLGFTGGQMGSMFISLHEVIYAGQGVWDDLMKSFSVLSSWWTTYGPAITAQARELFTGLIKGFGDVVARVGPFISQTLAKISAWFVDNGPLIQKFVTTFVQAWTQHILPAVVSFWSVVQPILGGLIDLILGIAKFIMQLATGDWAGAWSTMLSTLNNAITAIGTAINNFIDWVVTLFGDNMANVAATWSANWNMLSQIVASVGKIIVAAINTFLTGIWNSIKTWATNVQKTWSDNWNQFLENLKKIWDEIVTTIGEKMGGAARAVSDGIQDILGYLSAAYQDFVNAGGQIIAGLLRGIQGAWQTIVDWLTIEISKLIQDLLNALIHHGGGGGSTPQSFGRSSGFGMAAAGVGAGGGYTNSNVFYGGHTSNTSSMHIGPTNNYYVAGAQSPFSTLNNLRKGSAG